MEFAVNRFQAPDTHKPEKFAVPHQVCVETFSNEYLFPAIGFVAVLCKYMGLIFRKRPVCYSFRALFKAKMVFVFSFGKIFGVDEVVTKFLYWVCFDDV